MTAAKCNAYHFIQTPWRRWLNTCGELHISDGGDRERGFWAEPAHNDGAASILHLGLCLAGRKFVKFEQPGGMPDVIVEIEQGGVFWQCHWGAPSSRTHRGGGARVGAVWGRGATLLNRCHDADRLVPTLQGEDFRHDALPLVGLRMHDDGLPRVACKLAVRAPHSGGVRGHIQGILVSVAILAQDHREGVRKGF